MKKLALSATVLGALAMAACGGDSGDPVLPDANNGNVDAPPGGGVCNAVMQTGCQPGEKCSVRFIIDNDTAEGTTECMPDGSVGIGGMCAFAEDPAQTGTEIDNCSAGGFCRGGLCNTICTSGPGTCPDPNAEACVRISRTFSDQASPTGVCAPQCDPNEAGGGGLPPCAAGLGCYLIGYQGADDLDFVCAGVPAESVPLVAGQECAPKNAAGQCFVNSAPNGATITALNAQTQGTISVVAPYCRPTNTSVGRPAANANGLDGAVDTAGLSIECSVANLQSGGQIGGGLAPEFGCRDIGTAFGDPLTNPEGGDPATFVGMCVAQDGSSVGGSGWNESTIWDPQDLVDDAADGQIDNPTVSLCFGCLDADQLAILFPAVKLAEVRDTVTTEFLRTAKFYHELVRAK